MPNSKNHCSFAFFTPARQKTFEKGYKYFIAGSLIFYLGFEKSLWKFSEKQN